MAKPNSGSQPDAPEGRGGAKSSRTAKPKVTLPPRGEKKPKTRRPMDREELLAILEDIARNGGDSARIAAVKTLLSLKGQTDDAKHTDPFEALDSEDELAKRRSQAA
jgi:hypothetical protein